MRTAGHTGDAAAESLRMPLQLAARIRLDDAVTTAPAVVGDSVYVVDQMGSAYRIDWRRAKILWRAAPDGDHAKGSNTSSPCVVRGRVIYGTTAGRLHILQAETGKTVRTLDLGWPITGSPTFANDSIYVQTLGAVLHCLDLDGKERWTWDHYRRYTKPLPDRFKRYHPGSYGSPHFGGGEVAVSGRRVVTSFGWDQVCLEDKGGEAALAWCNRAALGKDDGIPMAASISGGYVYTAWPGVDGAGTLLRLALKDGTFERKRDQLGRDQWAIFGTPAVRNDTVYFGRHIRGVVAHAFGKGRKWESFRWTDRPGFTPTIASPALSRGHCLYTTLTGELVAVPLEAKGSGLDRLKPGPFRYRTPSGKPIGSSPAVSRGHVFFGSDDGCLYILGPEGKEDPPGERIEVHSRRTKAKPATGKKYAWPSPYGDPGNANFVPDPALKPPFRLRWAARSFGVFVQPPSAAGGDLVFVTLEGTVGCLEQATGRLRWRRRLLPADQLASSGVLCEGGRLYVARPARRSAGTFYCLDQETGNTVWTAELGEARWYARGAPLFADGVVAFGTRRGKEGTPTVDAWDAATGKPLWRATLHGKQWEPHGCVLDGVFYVSGAARLKGNVEGETAALDPKTGRILWRNRDVHCGYRGTPTGRDGRLYIIGWDQPVACLDASDGSVVWKTDRKQYWGHIPALGKDIYSGRGYSGRAEAFLLADGSRKTVDGKSIRLGGPDHACGPVVLTSGGLSLAVTVSGLYVRDVDTGEILWNSRGFAPRTCSSPAVANGRIFTNPQVNGMLYCFEPVLINQRR